ncbi:UNKNOWN [Stylonychia lemnae]|uniref:Uncharacterized protein n=1 Tax=Stylonychia lemnae TaxID=5949 RepID=A0A078APR3_STYLE|nr:UNKNOWN [Stylonychia lemnae]|eukprot:CDW83292.1 UNKNOWN [Stylonychia lemnae]
MVDIITSAQITSPRNKPSISLTAPIISISASSSLDQENSNEALDLSYQNNSIEIIGNNWDCVGDESTIEILQDFNLNGQENTQPNQIHLFNQDGQDQNFTNAAKKQTIKLGLTSGGQNFLSKVKTNTIKLFQKQSIISEESASQCQTSMEPSSFKNLSPLKIEGLSNDMMFNQQSASFSKSYFNQSQIKQNTSNSQLNNSQGVAVLVNAMNANKTNQVQLNTQTSVSEYGVTSITEVTNKAKNATKTQQNVIKNIKLINQQKSESQFLITGQINILNAKSQEKILDNDANQDNSKSGTIHLPFYRRANNQQVSKLSQNFNLTKQNSNNSPLRVYGSISTGLTSMNTDHLANQTLQKTKNIKILSYYSAQIPDKASQPDKSGKRAHSYNQTDQNSLLSSMHSQNNQNSENNASQSTAQNSTQKKTIKLSKCKVKLDRVIVDQKQTTQNKAEEEKQILGKAPSIVPIKKIISKSNIRILNKVSSQNESLSKENQQTRQIEIQNLKKKSPVKIKLKMSQIIDRENLKNTIVQQQQQKAIEDQEIDIYLEEEKTLQKQMERDIKCLHKFSEKTFISPNADVYRPKSTQPIHRKSFSFNSPHYLGGFLKRFNESYQKVCSNQDINSNDISRLINESSIINNDIDHSFMKLEDQSFVIANRYAT